MPSCNFIMQQYCLNCSKRDSKAVIAHEGESCADVAAGFGDSLRQYIHHITENILNMGCPTCGAAFLDFSGCCAVTCSCRQDFCGLCLAPSANGSVCHAHVLVCRLNPNKSYFCSTDELNEVHRRTRIDKLRRYFETTIPKGDVKRRVMKQCEVILSDVGISRQDIMG
jgi:hypothetical protein